MVWLSWLGIIPQGSLVQFPVGAHAWVAGSVPWSGSRESTDVSLSHRCFSPFHSPSLPLSLELIKERKKFFNALFQLARVVWEYCNWFSIYLIETVLQTELIYYSSIRCIWWKCCIACWNADQLILSIEWTAKTNPLSSSWVSKIQCKVIKYFLW